MTNTIRRAAISTIIVTTALSVVPAAAAAWQPETVRPSVSSMPPLAPAMLTALQRDLGLTVDEARAMTTRQARAAELAPTLRTTLGAGFGGAWVLPAGHANAGGLVVGITQARLAGVVRAAGATPRQVSHSEQTLETTKAAIDEAATRPTGIVAWFVDLPRNRVVVEALPESVSEVSRFTGSLTGSMAGGPVQVVAVDERPQPKYDIRGGDRFNFSGTYCSIGFAVDRGFVTAGHCIGVGTPTFGVDGTAQGIGRGSVFPGSDHAWVETNSAWVPQPKINGYSRGELLVGGSLEMPVNSSVCRSGTRSGYHCGTIQARNTSVTYPQGTVYGVTRTNVCADGGDSGGPFIAGYYAQGLASGGSGSCPGTDGRTYFQPLLPVLQTYGLTLMTTPIFEVTIVCYSGESLYYCEGSHSGTDPATLRWYRNGNHMPTMDGRQFFITPCTPTTYTTFRLEVTAPNGSGAREFTIRCSTQPRPW